MQIMASLSLPEISIAPNEIRVGHGRYPLQYRKRLHRILICLVSTECRVLHKDELIALLEGLPVEEFHRRKGCMTARQYRSLLTAATKQISRLRKHLEKTFGHLMPANTTWLYYSSIRNGWILYKLPGFGSDGQAHP